MEPVELTGLSREQMEELMVASDQPPYRGRQIYHALYHERQFDLGRISALPRALRTRLQERFRASLPEIEKTYHSVDGTARYLLRLDDGKEVETVWMPEERRNTICVS